MKILVLCIKSPYPPKEGGPIAMNAIIEGLTGQGHEVNVLTIDSWKYPVKRSAIPNEYLEKTNFEAVSVNLRINPIKAFFNLFTRKSYHVERYISKEFEEKLISILEKEKYDIVQLETLYLSPYANVIRKYSDAGIVLRSHNIEHRIWENITRNCSNPVKKLYLKHLTGTLKKYEFETMNIYDGIAAISRFDEEFYKRNNCTVPLTTINFGIDLMKLKITDQEAEFPGIFHIGSMNWIPNEEGIRWFIDNVWPEVISSHPELKLYLAGRHTPSWLLKKKHNNVEVIGEVDDAYDFINSKSIMIVPLFSGSGIRIKIIEAMALGKTVISTKTGADGIAYTENENILIANTPDEFVKAILKCSVNKEYCDYIGKNAKKLVENEHDNKMIMKKLSLFYKEIFSVKT